MTTPREEKLNAHKLSVVGKEETNLQLSSGGSIHLFRYLFQINTTHQVHLPRMDLQDIKS
jgi:hypothetical protein